MRHGSLTRAHLQEMLRSTATIIARRPTHLKLAEEKSARHRVKCLVTSWKHWCIDLLSVTQLEANSRVMHKLIRQDIHIKTRVQMILPKVVRRSSTSNRGFDNVTSVESSQKEPV